MLASCWVTLPGCWWRLREQNVIKIVFLALAQVQDISGESQLEKKNYSR